MPTAEDDLRPRLLSEYVGQRRLIEELTIRCEAARAQKRLLEPILLSAAPGYGKTSLAALIARMMGVRFHSVALPITTQALARTIATNPGKLLLLDEIHRPSKAGQEDLLTLLEFGYVSTRSGMKMPATGIMFVGATTREDRLDEAVHERFPIRPFFEPYEDEDLARLAGMMARRLGFQLTDEDALVLGVASAGVPRHARTLILALRDLSFKYGRPATAEEILAFTGLSTDGLTREHRQYLDTLARLNGQSGIKILSSLLGKSESTLAETERLLFTRGLVEPTPQGRLLTAPGYKKVHALRESAA